MKVNFSRSWKKKRAGGGLRNQSVNLEGRFCLRGVVESESCSKKSNASLSDFSPLGSWGSPRGQWGGCLRKKIAAHLLTLSQRIYYQHLCRSLNEPDLSICGAFVRAGPSFRWHRLTTLNSWAESVWKWTTGQLDVSLLDIHTHTEAHKQQRSLEVQPSWNQAKILIKDLLFQEVTYTVLSWSTSTNLTHYY